MNLLQWIETRFGVDPKRGLLTISVALLGAALLMIWLALSPALGIPGSGYFQSWAGACFRIASGAYGGYWISRGLLRIDLSQVASRFADQTIEQAVAVAAAQLARAVVVAATILAVVLAT